MSVVMNISINFCFDHIKKKNIYKIAKMNVYVENWSVNIRIQNSEANSSFYLFLYLFRVKVSVEKCDRETRVSAADSEYLERNRESRGLPRLDVIFLSTSELIEKGVSVWTVITRSALILLARWTFRLLAPPWNTRVHGIVGSESGIAVSY